MPLCFSVWKNDIMVSQPIKFEEMWIAITSNQNVHLYFLLILPQQERQVIFPFP